MDQISFLDAEYARDPEMHQAKKDNRSEARSRHQRHFGMKMHIGVNAENGTVHSLATTAANEHDITQAYKLGR